MRRAPVLVLLLAALALTPAAAAVLIPVRRDFGEASLPRVRPAPSIAVPVHHAPGRVEVILRLRSAPLAAWNARRLATKSDDPRLNPRSVGSRRYLAALAREQTAAERSLRAAIPEARVKQRYGVLLNALAVDLPARSLEKVTRLRWLTGIYPSLRYTLLLDTSPGVIGATELTALTGATGDGIKIAIVDDGVDPENPFFNPASFSYPEGFPRGDSGFTTAKVIVARSFAAFGAPPSSSLPFDPEASFHATHVAGIAAGLAGTTAPAGIDHPQTSGLTGVAPRAWIGNYRVFSIPTPLGSSANTPEIVAAFEQAVLDGMDVINFSGGGPETEPANDAMIETVENVVAAGIVPVISAGNERDQLGYGTVGTPGTAPDAITVAAASTTHVFAPVIWLDAADAPDALKTIPYREEAGPTVPLAWASEGQELAYVGSIQGTDGARVDPFLCSPGADPNTSKSLLPAGSLRGALALVARGRCALETKVGHARAAGAAGLVLVNNRPGEAEATGLIEATIPMLVISDLDGAQLRDYLTAHGGRASVRASRDPLEIMTRRSGVVTSFSSAGPTAFSHLLKPDLTAPGGQILSSTNPVLTGAPFAVFDGTSMSAPHVSGSAALLLEHHPGWDPWQVKSALVSTAARAFADTARTTEAPVTLAGGGLVDVVHADAPLVFSRPSSLSFGDLDVTRGAASRTETVTVSDAGGGGGTWTIEVRSQSSSQGASLSVPGALTVPAGGSVELPVAARASGGAAPGDDYGFVVLRRGASERRIPYLFVVAHPALATAHPAELRFFQEGTTATGPSRVAAYRFPTSPFSLFVDPGEPLAEDGAEQIYTFLLDRPVVNFGVAADVVTPGVQIDPFLLGSLDEGTVQGFAGTPTNVNAFTSGFLLPAGAAGASFPRAKRYVVAVDSGHDAAGRSLGGRYVLHAWADDLSPPYVGLETTQVGTRRSLLALRAFDDGAGVDPLSLAIVYGDIAVGAAAYDPFTGLALFPLPAGVPPLRAGRNRLLLLASDYQEAKNVLGLSTDPYPNTAFREVVVHVRLGRPTLSWLEPGADFCAPRQADLLVSADGPRRIRVVRFYDGDRLLVTDRAADAGSLFRASVRLSGTNRHRLRAVAVDASGREASATRTVSPCG